MDPIGFMVRAESHLPLPLFLRSALFTGALVTSSEVFAALPEFDCVVEPNQVVELSSPTAGVIESIAVDRSDLVQEDQVLAQLKSGMEAALVALNETKAKFTGEIDSKQASLDFAKRNHSRTNKLYARKAVPFHVLDEAQTEALLAASSLREARQNRRLAELELVRARESLKLREVRSPISGVVMDRTKSPGEYVDDKPILTIAQLDPLRVEVIVPVSSFGEIKRGMRAEVTPELPTTRKHLARVTVVDRVIDAASGTFGVRLELPNPNNALPGGLRCRLKFLISSQPAGGSTTSLKVQDN